MERQRLMVGYDLCADYSQISYYNTEKEEPDSVNFDGQNEIPTVLCRLFSNGEWLAGQQALKAAEAGNGVLVRDFIVRIADDPMVDVAGERMEKAGLIGIFLQKTLKALETVCECGGRIYHDYHGRRGSGNSGCAEACSGFNGNRRTVAGAGKPSIEL